MTRPSFDPKDKVIVVTGGGRGIGRALAERFHAEGARALAVVDLDLQSARAVAERVGGEPWRVDVAEEAAVLDMVGAVEATHGPIDLYCSNAGLLYTDAPQWTVTSQATAQWQRCWEVNVLAHVHACRALLPGMIGRGGGAILITASAAGLLSQIGDAVYSTTKHAAVGFAESLAIAHGDDGLYVGVLCPQAVATDMIRGRETGAAAIDGVMPPGELARRTVEAMRAGQFMIRPHAQVVDYFRRKAQDYDRWIGGMRKLRRARLAATGQAL